MEEKDIISQIKEGRTVSKSMVEEVNKVKKMKGEDYSTLIFSYSHTLIRL